MKKAYIIVPAVILLAIAALYFGGIEPRKQAIKEPVKYILVLKSKHKLLLYGANHRLINQYKVALGFSPRGDKIQEGDGKTPTGKYYIAYKNASSRFHKSMLISYPNSVDMTLAKLRNVTPGGDIMVHGIGKNGFIGNIHTFFDWTNGCIAVTNEEIDAIYAAVQIGTPIEIIQ